MADKHPKAIKREKEAKKEEFTSWRQFTLQNTSIGTMLHNKTGSWRFIRPVYEDKTPACQNACPAGNDIEAWIKLIGEKKYEEAYWRLKLEEPFPAILGRVCFKFCERQCNRNGLDGYVGINALERFVGDQVELSTPDPNLAEPNGKTVAIVGSGPAGMSAAYYLRKLGFAPTIFEAQPEPGGVLRFGVPEYRLPKSILEKEFEGLKNMGIEIKCNTRIGKDISLDELREKFDYVFLATGVHKSRPLGIEGEDSEHVLSGLEMLRRTAFGEKLDLGKKVAVIGGGNTAIDAARTALRLGLDVEVIYRRTEAEMPAHHEEVEEARQEGVKFRFLAAPERIEFDSNGNIARLVCTEMELGEPDESGRRRPVKKPDALFDVEVDTVISAIGELADFDYLKDLVPNDGWVVKVDEGLRALDGNDGKAKVYAGGDIIDIDHTVVHAVAAGKKAAIAIDCDLKGKDVTAVLDEIAVGDAGAISFAAYIGIPPLNDVRQDKKAVVRQDKIVFDYFEEAERSRLPMLGPDERKGSFAEVYQTISEEVAQYEAKRCFHCGRCIECDNCLVFCPDMAVLAHTDGKFGYEFDYNYCKGCGICYKECPRYAISMVDEETLEKVE